MGYVEGSNREQGALFPSHLDDFVEENNPVRVIDGFVEFLKFEELEFERAEPAERGRPGYDPRVLLGIYLWGHLNGVRSSRRLERECGRNVELMWLTGQLRPDFKTLCRFRVQNGEAIKRVLVEFRKWAIEVELYGSELVAIDGSKFKAVNSRRRNVTRVQLEKMMARERAAVERYLEDLREADEADAKEEVRRLTVEELQAKIATIAEFLKKSEEVVREMKEGGETQRSLTDRDSRLMKTSEGMAVSYNVQTAVDDKHKLIAVVEVTNAVADQGLLSHMAEQAKEALETEELSVVADGGYFGFDDLEECEEKGITTYVPVPELGRIQRGKGLFTRDQFTYDKERDVFICPQREELAVVSQGKRKDRNNKEYKSYRTKACGGCPLRDRCTKSKRGRQIRRWANAGVLERLQARLKAHPEILKRRKALAEHPFGTIKVSMNHERLLLKGLKKVAIEINLTVLCYNLKRVMTIFGVSGTLNRIRAQTI
jgi:transposase